VNRRHEAGLVAPGARIEEGWDLAARCPIPALKPRRNSGQEP
jgi:hypothetical protein